MVIKISIHGCAKRLLLFTRCYTHHTIISVSHSTITMLWLIGYMVNDPIIGIGILFVTFVSILHTLRRILQPPDLETFVRIALGLGRL